MPEPRALTIAEFCATFRISRSTIYRELRDGRLRAVKRGRRTLVLADEAERWFQALEAYRPLATGHLNG